MTILALYEKPDRTTETVRFFPQERFSALLERAEETRIENALLVKVEERSLEAVRAAIAKGHCQPIWIREDSTEDLK